MRLRSHLILLVLAAVLPLLIFTGFIVYDELAKQREILHRGMRNTVRALSLALDGEVKASRGILQTLAVSPALTAGDYASFHALSTQAVAGRQGADIVLLDRTGQQLVNTRRPFGVSRERFNYGFTSSHPAHITPIRSVSSSYLVPR